MKSVYRNVNNRKKMNKRRKKKMNKRRKKEGMTIETQQQIAKELNGTEVRVRIDGTRKRYRTFPGILLVDLSVSDFISIKPYGVSPKELYKTLGQIGWNAPLYFFEDPKYCFATIRITHEKSCGRLLKLVRAGEVITRKKVMGDDNSLARPVCPY